MTNYATFSQAVDAFETFIPAAGSTMLVEGVLVERFNAESFWVWMVRQDDTGDHYGLDVDAATQLGLPT